MEKQYERLYIVLHNPSPLGPEFKAYAVGDAANPVSMDEVFKELAAVH